MTVMRATRVALPALLVVRGRRERSDAHVPVVELGREPLDRAALPGRVPALEQHAHRRPEPGRLPPGWGVADQPAQLEPQRGKALLRGHQPLLVLLARELEA